MLDWILSTQAAVARQRVLNTNGPTALEDKGDWRLHGEALRKLGHHVQIHRHEGG